MNRWRLFDHWPDAAKQIVFKALTELHEKYAAVDAYDDPECIDAEILLEVLHYRVKRPEPLGRAGDDECKHDSGRPSGQGEGVSSGGVR